MLSCKPVCTPLETNLVVDRDYDDNTDSVLKNITEFQKLVGKLIYLTITRPDISYSVQVLSQFMHSPRKSHLAIAMRLLRYLKNSPGKGISDGDWAKCLFTRRSVSGYVVFFCGTLISWKSKKQSTISRSSTESEYRALGSLTCELIWVIKILTDLNLKFCFLESAVKLAINPVFHEKTKHFEVDVHFIREKIVKESSKLQIEKFDGKDFSWWKMQIEDLLVQKDLDAVLGEKPEKMTQTEWETLDKKAKTFIRLALSKDVAFNILKETSAKGIMEALSNMYEKPSAAKKVFLIRELVNTRMREGNSVTIHINNFNSILSRLGSVGIKFEDEVQALLLLSSLPDSWSGTVTAVTSSAGSKEFTFEGIRDLILGEDVRRRNSGESSSEQLNAVREVGHFRNQCPNDKKEANVAVDHSDDDFLICSMESNVDSWVMDSGASFHATHSREALWNLKEGDFGKVRLANDEVLDVTGMGDIELKTSVGSWTLKDVRFIPSLKKQLISVGQLDELGHEVKFKNGQWKVVKGNLVIARGRKRGSLYMVSLPSEGVTVSEQKKNKIRFIESRGQMKVCFADGKPRVTGQIQIERVWNGSGKPVKGINSSGSKGCTSARIPRTQCVKKTSIPSVKISPDYLPHMESVDCSQDIPGSGSSFQWEPVETENRSVAVLAMTDVLELTGTKIQAHVQKMGKIIHVTLWNSFVDQMQNFIANQVPGIRVIVILQFASLTYIRGRPMVSNYFGVSKLIMNFNDITMIADLNPNKEDYTLKVRIIRIWKFTSWGNPNDVRGFGMVLIDEKGDRIECTVDIIT
ncbi:hypothetical protein LXL04_016918 [Taraxacum kok-saghyz]